MAQAAALAAPEFAGGAAPLDARAVADAARRLGCAVEAIRAVVAVESRGGFLADGRPRILFERHVFARLTDHRHDETSPDISAISPGGYRGGAAEYARLAEAMALDRRAALRAASWGAFQIMGDNFARCGFDDVEHFVAAMVSGEPAQLAAFVAFLEATRLAAPLARLDWTAFARGYNGPAYRSNRYDERLAAAFERERGAATGEAARPLLRLGDRSEAVRRVQRTLGLEPDGIFGPRTRAAVVALQQAKGLVRDGVVGSATWSALGA